MSAQDFDILERLPGHVAEKIHAVLPDLHECQGTMGRFDAERLKEESVRAPAVLVSLLDMRAGQSFADRHQGFALSMAAFIVTRDVMGVDRDIAAARICQAVSQLVPGNTWDWESLGPAENLRAQPIVTKSVRKTKLALWAVTWVQPCVLEPIPEGEVIPLSVWMRGLGKEDHEEVGT